MKSLKNRITCELYLCVDQVRVYLFINYFIIEHTISFSLFNCLFLLLRRLLLLIALTQVDELRSINIIKLRKKTKVEMFIIIFVVEHVYDCGIHIVIVLHS